MATPHVAGGIALWLEADPTLTIDDVKEIIEKTAIKDEYVLMADPVQAGAGKFNAYEGLEEVIRRATGIGTITADRQRTVFTQVGDRAFKVFLGGARQLKCTVCTISGVSIMTQTTSGDETLLDVSSLAKGTYIISVNGHSSKIVLTD